MNKLQIKPLVPNFIAPKFGTEGAAGFDIFLQKDILVFGDDATFVELGFAAEIPEGYMCLIMPRSGKGSNDGLQIRNTVGLVDSDYRGEWKAMLTTDGLNLGEENESLYYARGEALLQGVLIKKPEFEIELTDQLSETVRGEGGFGSTGN